MKRVCTNKKNLECANSTAPPKKKKKKKAQCKQSQSRFKDKNGPD